MTSENISEVLEGWREAGNMTAEQDNALQDLAKDTKVRMIQGLTPHRDPIPSQPCIFYY